MLSTDFFIPGLFKNIWKIAYNQLLKYLESNNLLDKEQHGFRPDKSIITAGFEFIKSIVDSIDAKEYFLTPPERLTVLPTSFELKS